MKESDSNRVLPERRSSNSGLAVEVKDPQSIAQFVDTSLKPSYENHPLEVTIPLLDHHFSHCFLESIHSEMTIDNLYENRVLFRVDGFLSSQENPFSKDEFVRFWKEMESVGYKVRFTRDIDTEKFFDAHESYLAEFFQEFCASDLTLLISEYEYQRFQRVLSKISAPLTSTRVISYLLESLPDFFSILENSFSLTISDANTSMQVRLPTNFFKNNLSYSSEYTLRTRAYRSYMLKTMYSLGEIFFSNETLTSEQIVNFSRMVENVLRALQKLRLDPKHDLLVFELQTKKAEKTQLDTDFIEQWRKEQSDAVMAWLESLANQQEVSNEQVQPNFTAPSAPADETFAETSLLSDLDLFSWLESLAQKQDESYTEDIPEPTSPRPFEKKENKGVSFVDIIGQEKAVRQAQILVDTINNEAVYKKWGSTVPRGILLEGPPGTGKTSLAKAIANEAHAEFFYLDSNEILGKWFSESEQKIGQIFDNAEKIAKEGKKVVLFIDDIDGLTPKRSGDELAITLNRITTYLLTRLDGFKSREGVIFLAATNHRDLIDPAMIRSGRIDSIVELEKPSQEGILKLLTYYVEKIKSNAEEPERVFDPNINFGILALESYEAGFTGADIEAFMQQVIREKIFDMSENNKDWTPVNLTDLLNSFRGFRI